MSLSMAVFLFTLGGTAQAGGQLSESDFSPFDLWTRPGIWLLLTAAGVGFLRLLSAGSRKSF